MAARWPAGPEPITMRSYFSMSKGESITSFGGKILRAPEVSRGLVQLKWKLRTKVR